MVAARCETKLELACNLRRRQSDVGRYSRRKVGTRNWKLALIYARTSCVQEHGRSHSTPLTRGAAIGEAADGANQEVAVADVQPGAGQCIFKGTLQIQLCLQICPNCSACDTAHSAVVCSVLCASTRHACGGGAFWQLKRWVVGIGEEYKGKSPPRESPPTILKGRMAVYLACYPRQAAPAGVEHWFPAS